MMGMSINQKKNPISLKEDNLLNVCKTLMLFIDELQECSRPHFLSDTANQSPHRIVFNLSNSGNTSLAHAKSEEIASWKNFHTNRWKNPTIYKGWYFFYITQTVYTNSLIMRFSKLQIETDMNSICVVITRLSDKLEVFWKCPILVLVCSSPNAQSIVKFHHKLPVTITDQKAATEQAALLCPNWYGIAKSPQIVCPPIEPSPLYRWWRWADLFQRHF